MINFDDFKKVDLRVARVISAERVDGSEKLLKLQVDLGTEESGGLGERQILAGIGKVYSPEDLVGKSIAVVANLEPRKIMGMESEGMVIASGGTEMLSLFFPDKEIDPGSQIS